jgi:hypothetical protein
MPNPTANWAMTRNGFGGFVFFGARFFELNLGVLYKNPDLMNIEGEKWSKEKSQLFGTFALQFGVYLKVPFNFSTRFTFFPTIGADFEYTVDSNVEWWHDIWARAGLGFDLLLGKKENIQGENAQGLFLRGQALYGAAFPVAGADYLGVRISHGPLVKFGLGWMF